MPKRNWLGFLYLGFEKTFSDIKRLGEQVFVQF